jgi:hypothetical protein
MPHQAVVLMTVAGLSLLLTLGLMSGTFRREKKRQESNTDEH